MVAKQAPATHIASTPTLAFVLGRPTAQVKLRYQYRIFWWEMTMMHMAAKPAPVTLIASTPTLVFALGRPTAQVKRR